MRRANQSSQKEVQYWTRLATGQGRWPRDKILFLRDCAHSIEDIVLWSQKRKVFAIELTVPWERRCAEAHERKKANYEDLLIKYRQQEWLSWNIPVEFGARGFPAESVWSLSDL